MKPIKRALLTVSDKTGLLGLAEVLHRHNVEMISTGGTGSILRNAGFPITDVSSLTGHAEAFGGRVKTLSFEIAAALLFDRDRDAPEAARLGISPIDLLVCNLYPFQKAFESGATDKELIEQIDIGGVTLIRSAAKNADAIAVVVDPADYQLIASELDSGNGCLEADLHHRLMRKAFNHTADYDSAIATALDERAGEKSLRPAFCDGRTLRYGENPHQSATVFRRRGADAPFRVLQGKELSYTNLLDIHAATTAVAGLGQVACAVVKHGNPCGLAVGKTPVAAFDAAWAGDPVSAFGSVIAFNDVVALDVVSHFGFDDPDRAKRKFIEIVAAPGFAPGTARKFGVRAAVRLVEWAGYGASDKRTYHILGSLLLSQDSDKPICEKLASATKQPFPVELEALANFGIHAVTRIQSNAIAIARQDADGGMHLLGMGAGQPNRVTSVSLAITKARENLQSEAASLGIDRKTHVSTELSRSVLVSDAFFPFPDSIDLCADAGIRLVVQPGGSKRDPDVIAKADERGISMAFSGRRHFRH